MQILSRLQKSRNFWFLLIISIVFFFLRFPSLFEPDWYGDEGVYQVVGIGMNAGRLLYKGVFDNKPPLLYVLYSLVSSDLFSIKLVSLIFGLLSVLVFFYLSKKLFQNQKITFAMTIVYAILFGLPLIEGNIANAENFMLLPNLIAAFLIFKSSEIKLKKPKYKIQILAGFIIGLSFLFKVVAVFDFAAFLLFLFFVNYQNNLTQLFKTENLIKEIKLYFPFVLGFAGPILFTVLYFIFNNAFSDFITATFFSNIGYVGYGNTLVIPQGLLILKLFILGLFVIFIFYKRKKINTGFIFVSLWFAFSLFDAFFSQRPYTHYLLTFLPSFCLMLGMIFLNKSFSKLSVLLAVFSLIIIFHSFGFYGKTSTYYQNFISFITDNESVNSYQKFFDSNTPNDYEIASFLNLYTKKNDNIFIWGNNAQLYYLANKLPPGKYTVAYHITNYKDGLINTQNSLAITKPKFIVIMPNVPNYPFDLLGYYQRLNINNIEIYEKIY